LNRLIYYPTGSYGTFVQWLCNTVSIAGPQDLPFDVDGNSHKYVLSDQYRLLISDQSEQEFVCTSNATVVSCIWPLEHNGKVYNEHCQPDFYYQFSCQHLKFFTDSNVKILVIHPTDTSKIWWWHNNCKKVFYNQQMFDKKIKGDYTDLPWLTTIDPIQRARVQMSYYDQRTWYKKLLQIFKCATVYDLGLGQLRAMISQSMFRETFDYVSHWQQLPAVFPSIKFVSLDQLRHDTTQTIRDIFEYFGVESALPLDYVVEQWQQLQLSMHRDQLHEQIINCIVNQQELDWSHAGFDLFDEVYLYHELKYQHNITLDADSIDCLPTNSHDLLRLAR
jgi:hypothetical protein